jgi:hypothetical protein
MMFNDHAADYICNLFWGAPDTYCLNEMFNNFAIDLFDFQNSVVTWH